MKVIDLSMPLYTGMPVYDGDPQVTFDIVHTHETHSWELRQLSLGSHTGTHVDAFSHMHKGQATLDDMPLERFFGKAQAVTLHCDWPSNTGLLFVGDVGPGLAADIISRNPGFVGGNIHEDLERILLGQGIVTYTNLVNLELLPLGTAFMFYGLPLKIHAGDGSPIRAIAILPGQQEDTGS
ncbi:cyclase family protein [Paenibacillus xerothermodurans]|uniref:Cyclase family protein n=1 Tax=Paenibacillus xerothermodurans TaxID=1977292 RepID=A0A2W1NVC1_PAEXE|nr:cyclase family protein [Paenibacillus xerothermodurans]PZE21716.1 cyclase family protein [Paenibacillus xerothermodurans]